MPDARPPLPVDVLVGGTGPVRFGVALDSIGRILEHTQLPEQYRSVNVPRLLGTTEADEVHDRYAEVPAAGEAAHLRLGPEISVEPALAEHVEPVPRILDRTAARWGWRGLWCQGERVVVLLDARRLSSIGARTTREVVR